MLNYNPNGFFKKTILFFLLVVLASNFLRSQDLIYKLDTVINSSIDRIYGMDPLLYNGMLYKHFYPPNVRGDQYLLSKNYIKGTLILRGIRYNNLDLNYDIYNQELLLKFSYSNNAYSIIMVSKAWLESFTIENMRFVYFNSTDSTKKIYQVLGNDSLKLMNYWKKELKIDNNIGNSNYYFSQTKELNLLINDSLCRFYSNRSFVHLFPKEKQILIKKYIRKNKINVKKTTDFKLEELINYCSSI